MVLGPIQLERDGQVVATRARKRLEILAYLLEARIAGRSEVSTLNLLDTFYPNEAENQGKNTLKQKMYEIRTSLGQAVRPVLGQSSCRLDTGQSFGASIERSKAGLRGLAVRGGRGHLPHGVFSHRAV